MKPRSTKATSIAPAAFDALKQNTAGEVHSVFDRTFNILIGDKLVGVARSGVSRSPINLITDIPADETMSSLGIKKGMPVQVTGNRVLVDEVLEISLQSAELWRPKTRASRCLSSELIQRNLELAKRLAANKGGREGLGQLLTHIDEIATGWMPPTSDLNMTAKAVLPRLVDLVKAVRSESVEGVKRATQKLIGLGPGLSPSADDALSGFTAALWWVSHSLNRGVDHAEEISQVITGQAGGTTLLSGQLLQHAARGEVNELIEKFLEALLVGGSPEIEPRVEQVLKIGETSGIDMMVGLLLGVQLGLGMEG